MGLLIRRHALAFSGATTHMLPNFKIVIGGVVIFVLLFAVTGAGILTPQVYTRVGAMPEIGRPMMQRAIADKSAQFPAVTRRADELRLRELALLVAVPEQAADEDEQATVAPAADEKSDGTTEPIIATIAADSASAALAAPPPSGPGSIDAHPPVLSAREEPVAATTAALITPDSAAGPTGAAAQSTTDADQGKPAANAPRQARPASRQGALDADFSKPGDANHAANSDIPKRHHRIAAHARKRLAAVHRVRQATTAPTVNPAINFFGQTSFQSHF
jgi:hypothetical protein